MLERHVYERMFIHETLMDVVLDAVEMRDTMESSGRVESWQRAKLLSMKWQLEMLMRMGHEVTLEDEALEDEVVAMVKRIHRAQQMVLSMLIRMRISHVRSVGAEVIDEYESGDDSVPSGGDFTGVDSQEEECADDMVEVDRNGRWQTEMRSSRWK